jgi:hypothetical protein
VIATAQPRAGCATSRTSSDELGVGVLTSTAQPADRAYVDDASAAQVRVRPMPRAARRHGRPTRGALVLDAVRPQRAAGARLCWSRRWAPTRWIGRDALGHGRCCNKPVAARQFVAGGASKACRVRRRPAAPPPAGTLAASAAR